MTRILCFGDSITWGANDLEMGGWASRLRHHYDNNFDGEPSVYNLGISGEKTAELLARFESECNVRKRGKDLIMIIATGINDSLHKPHSGQTDLREFENDYRTLLNKAFKAGRVIILTPTNVDDNHPKTTYRNSHIESYTKVIRKIAAGKKVRVVNVFGIMSKEDLKTDGLHPEASGHQKITKVLISKLDNMQGLKGQKATLLSSVKLYIDGGSRGNPGHSAGAFVICKMDDNVVEKSGFYIGIATNNQAEYQALLKGLQRSVELGIRKLKVFMDSELIVKQLNGLYKIKNKDLELLFRQVKELTGDFKEISFTHVPRLMNKEADNEVNRILDEH